MSKLLPGSVYMLYVWRERGKETERERERGRETERERERAMSVLLRTLDDMFSISVFVIAASQ